MHDLALALAKAKELAELCLTDLNLSQSQFDIAEAARFQAGVLVDAIEGVTVSRPAYRRAADKIDQRTRKSSAGAIASTAGIG